MKRNKQIIIPLAVLAIGFTGFFAFSSMKTAPEEKVKLDNTPIVTVTKVTVAPLTLTVDSYGIVQPKYQTELVAQISGEIVELSDDFVRGGLIKAGQLLARIDPNNYQAALIEAQASLATAHSALEQERAKGKVAAQQWQHISHQAPTQLSLRQPQLAQELAKVKASQALVLRAKRDLERTEIRAPYDAMIANRDIGLGSFVSVGSNIGHVLGTAIAEVRLPVADNHLQFLKQEGQQADVKLTGTYAGKKLTWNARIVRSEGVIDLDSRMNYLVAEIKDPYQLMVMSEGKVSKGDASKGDASKDSEGVPQAAIKFGAYVNAQILGVEIAQASVVPRYLVNSSDHHDRIASLDSESRLQYLDVVIMREQGDNVIISRGLHHGDQVITSSLNYPVNGMKLALAKTNIELDGAQGAEQVEEVGAEIIAQAGR